MEISNGNLLDVAAFRTIRPEPPTAKTNVADVAGSFGNVLANAIQSVENMEKQVHMLNEQFITGQLSDVHNLIIASEKAYLGLQLTVQVRNKVIEAYQEIMRIQL